MVYTFDTIQICIFCACILSAFSSLTIIITFFICKKWRLELYDLKKVMIALCVYHFIYCFAYIDIHVSDNDILCRIQASILQFFGVGTMIYEGIISIECYVLFNMFLQGKESASSANSVLKKSTRSYSLIYKYPHSVILNFLSSNQMRRHMIYHVSVILYGFFTTFFMNYYHYYGTSEKIVDQVCWVNEPWYNLLFGLLPMAISIIFVAVLNTNIIYMIVSAFGVTATDSHILQQPKCSSSGTHDLVTNTACAVDTLLEPLKPCVTCVSLFSRLSPRSKHAFFRLVAIPISFVLLAVPGIIRRIMIMQGYDPDALRVLTIITLMLATSGGTCNAIIWLVTDEVVQRDWSLLFQYLGALCIALCSCNMNKLQLLLKKHEIYLNERRNSSFSGPESEYSSVHSEQNTESTTTTTTAYNYLLDSNVDSDNANSRIDIETAIENGMIDNITELIDTD